MLVRCRKSDKNGTQGEGEPGQGDAQPGAELRWSPRDTSVERKSQAADGRGNRQDRPDRQLRLTDKRPIATLCANSLLYSHPVGSQGGSIPAQRDTRSTCTGRSRGAGLCTERITGGAAVAGLSVSVTGYMHPNEKKPRKMSRDWKAFSDLSGCWVLDEWRGKGRRGEGGERR